MVRTCSRHRKRILSFNRKSERQEPLRRYRRRWENNIKMYLTKNEGVICTQPAHGSGQWWALVNTAKNP
jgi:hypothetical protein